MRRSFLLFVVESKLLILIVDDTKCLTIEHTVIWVKHIFSILPKKRTETSFKLFVEKSFIPGRCRPLNSNFTIRKCKSVCIGLINILRFYIKTYCWHFLFKVHFVALCGDFCNIYPSLFCLLWLQYSRATQNGCAFHFIHSPSVTWKLHFQHFRPKLT